MSRWFILAGKVPIEKPMLEAVKWLEKHSNKVICQTIIGEAGKILVSTVFLGLDHNYDPAPSSAPVLFETLVFNGPMDQHMDRYCTYAEAEHGHEAIVREIHDLLAVQLLPAVDLVEVYDERQDLIKKVLNRE